MKPCGFLRGHPDLLLLLLCSAASLASALRSQIWPLSLVFLFKSWRRLPNICPNTHSLRFNFRNDCGASLTLPCRLASNKQRLLAFLRVLRKYSRLCCLLVLSFLSSPDRLFHFGNVAVSMNVESACAFWFQCLFLRFLCSQSKSMRRFFKVIKVKRVFSDFR